MRRLWARGGAAAASRPPLVIRAPRADGQGGDGRVWADVDGQPLWFESDDARLEPAPEAWASALLLSAAYQGRRLISEAPLSESWLENLERLRAVLADRWRLGPLALDAPVAEDDRGPDGRPTGLFFTAGVDSFHNLLRPRTPFEDLVYVQGYNFSVDDE